MCFNPDKSQLLQAQNNAEDVGREPPLPSPSLTGDYLQMLCVRTHVCVQLCTYVRVCAFAHLSFLLSVS